MALAGGAHLSRALELTCLSHSSRSACGAFRLSSRVKKRIVASLPAETMYELGPACPGTMAEDQIELHECGIVWTRSVSAVQVSCAVLFDQYPPADTPDQTRMVPSSPELIAPDPSGIAATE